MSDVVTPYVLDEGDDTTISGELVFASSGCPECNRKIMRLARCSYVWHGATWWTQAYFCVEFGHLVFRSKPERV